MQTPDLEGCAAWKNSDISRHGGVAEWFKAAVLKSGNGDRITNWTNTHFRANGEALGNRAATFIQNVLGEVAEWLKAQVLKT